MRTPSPLPALLAGALVALTGCHSLDADYRQATLDEVLKGQVASPDGRFRIPKPAIPVARRNTGIVREGSVFIVIVGPGLKVAVDEHASEGTEYGVRLMRDPHAYLVLERIWTEGREIDLFEGVDRLRFDFPELVQRSRIPTGDFPEYTVTEPLPEEGLVHLEGFTLERREIAPALRDALAPALRGSAKAARYVLESGGVEVLVAVPDRSTRLMLDFLILENRPFDGGIRIAQRLDPRNADGFRAAVDVRWISLGGDLCFRAPGEADAAPATSPT